jgi:tetratricopeptide (TPR) repeat protein
MKLMSKGILFVCMLICCLAYGQEKSKSKELYNKGIASFSRNNYREAIQYFNESIKLDSGNYDAWLKRGFCKSFMKDFEGEMSDYSYVIQTKPDHKWSYISRGGAYNRLGKYDLAIADFDKALSLDSKDAEVYNNRGFAKKMKGDHDGACQDWNQSRKLGNSEAKVILKNNLCK